TDDVYVIQGARDCAPSPTARLSAARSPGFSRHTPRKVTLVVSRNCLIPLITLATLFAATPALAQELIPFEVTKDKKLTVKVKVEGKERILRSELSYSLNNASDAICRYPCASSGTYSLRGDERQETHREGESGRQRAHSQI